MYEGVSALGLELLYHVAHHSQRPLFGAVLFAVGDDGDEDVVAFLRPRVHLCDAFADGVVEGCASAGAVGFGREVLRLGGRRVVVVPGGVAGVEGEECDLRRLVSGLWTWNRFRPR